MPRPAPPRLHRLPQWADQTLVPAPLDISITEVAGKSPLPTIIVTPSSPSSTQDFSLAFIPSPPKKSLRKRLESYKPPKAPSLRVRSTICMFLLLFFICHLLAHRLTTRYPRSDFASAEADASSGDHIPPRQSFSDWFDFWPKVDRADRTGEKVPKIIVFDHEVGGWLD